VFREVIFDQVPSEAILRELELQVIEGVLSSVLATPSSVLCGTQY
jgi:hypothetical protein